MNMHNESSAQGITVKRNLRQENESQTKDVVLSSICFYSCFGEGNGNPLQCSCLENPRDRGAW